MTVYEEFAALLSVQPFQQSFRHLVKPASVTAGSRHALYSGLAKADGDPCLACGCFLYFDDIDGAHDKVYDMPENDEATLWHGLVHRREGDFFNAKYHLHRVPGLCAELMIDSVGITDRAEVAHRANIGHYPEELLEEVRREWRLLMEYGLHRRAGL